jgi:hypothetical protein
MFERTADSPSVTAAGQRERSTHLASDMIATWSVVLRQPEAHRWQEVSFYAFPLGHLPAVAEAWFPPPDLLERKRARGGELHVPTLVRHAGDDEADAGPVVEPRAYDAAPARCRARARKRRPRASRSTSRYSMT